MHLSANCRIWTLETWFNSRVGHVDRLLDILVMVYLCTRNLQQWGAGSRHHRGAGRRGTGLPVQGGRDQRGAVPQTHESGIFWQVRRRDQFPTRVSMRRVSVLFINNCAWTHGRAGNVRRMHLLLRAWSFPTFHNVARTVFMHADCLKSAQGCNNTQHQWLCFPDLACPAWACVAWAPKLLALMVKGKKN